MHPLLRPSLLLLLPLLLPLSSPQLPPPLPPSSLYPNITNLMSLHACTTFAQLLRFSAAASSSFSANFFSGITIFCPCDPAFDPFLPQFNSLSADAKISLLLFHAIPAYYSIQMLESGNGVVNTLASDGYEKSFNFTMRSEGDGVTLRTGVSAARVSATVFDVDPVGVYSIDRVLMPEELFKKEGVVGVVGPAAAVDSPVVVGPDGKAADNSGGGGGEGEGIVVAMVVGFAMFFV